jgi:Tol biopolymer transport system component
MFAADRDGDENSQLYLVDVDGQEIRQLTDASDAQHVAARGTRFHQTGN